MNTVRVKISIKSFMLFLLNKLIKQSDINNLVA